ncbi:VOC family protein [Microvirga arsenatis]|uniref:VOC family protein n=1 Tax=Microvirga arsenatis TaxID=2692265 RepID=A0ABW9YS78_9HYPH|nr:VOC family protein [Microvirga arsenatis]NBJ11576.1 VOC family protein [Microvirga arsenatis]NBJ22785.1 VOC family protein [Microvirga arsenatis]
MYSHTTVGANDLARARAFYEAVFAPLGLEMVYSDDTYLAWAGPGRPPQFFVGKPFNGERSSPGNGFMIALLAPRRSAVDACHAAALEQGGTDEGRPGLRPHYHKDYYGAYFRDLDGNKICVVCHQPE